VSNNNPFLGSVEVVAAPPSNVAQPAFLGTVEAETITKSLYASNYGVKADAQFVLDAVSTNGSTAISSASANFTQADVGKIVFGVDNTGVATSPVQGTILAVIDANHITVSNASTASKTGVTLGWGTDDSAACAAAWAAAVAAQKYLILPSGFIFVQSAQFYHLSPRTEQNLGLLSDGFSTLCPTPNFNFSSAPTTTSGLFFHIVTPDDEVQPNYCYIENIGVYGAGQLLSGNTSFNSIFYLAKGTIAINVWAWMWGCGSDLIGITCNGPVDAYNVVAFYAGAFGIVVNGSQTVNFYGCYSGDNNVNLSIGAGATLNSFGSQWGSQNGNGANVVISGTFNSYGDQFLPGPGSVARQFDVNSGGILNLSGAEVISTTVPYGINLFSGGRAFVSNTTWKLSAAGAVVLLYQAGGVYQDDGTNVVLAGAVPGMAAANITPSTGWGTSGAAGNGVSAVAGDISRFSFTITAAGTPAPNPTIAIVFPWTQNRVPFFIVQQVGGTGAIVPVTISTAATTTGMTLTWNGTPAAGSTYIITCLSR
jgi:hypothetical protein